MESAIQTTLDCYKSCLETKKYCLQKGGKHADPKHIQA